MYNIEKTRKLLNYINNPMSREGVNVLYSANNINYDRCQLYSDYVQSLLLLIFDTYMGDEITDSEQQKHHFKWCWDKNVLNFKDEGIHIHSEKLFNYFHEFMMEIFYTLNDKINQENFYETLQTLWLNIFDYNGVKTNADMDTLIQVYKLFEKSHKTNVSY